MSTATSYVVPIDPITGNVDIVQLMRERGPMPHLTGVQPEEIHRPGIRIAFVDEPDNDEECLKGRMSTSEVNKTDSVNDLIHLLAVRESVDYDPKK